MFYWSLICVIECVHAGEEVMCIHGLYQGLRLCRERLWLFTLSPLWCRLNPRSTGWWDTSHGLTEESTVSVWRWPPTDPVVNWTEMKTTICSLEKMHLKLLWDFKKGRGCFPNHVLYVDNCSFDACVFLIFVVFTHEDQMSSQRLKDWNPDPQLGQD